MIEITPDQIPRPEQLVQVTHETCALDRDARLKRVRETDLSLSAWAILLDLINRVGADTSVRVSDYMDNEVDRDEITPVRFAELAAGGFVEFL